MLDTAAPRAFLDVVSSVTGRVWRDRLDAQASVQALAIAQRQGVPDLLARVLAGRGVTVDTAEAYLDPSIRGWMPAPAALTDMEFCAARLASAVTERRRVAVFGD